jgi:hypothetical protein
MIMQYREYEHKRRTLMETMMLCGRVETMGMGRAGPSTAAGLGGNAARSIILSLPYVST